MPFAKIVLGLPVEGPFDYGIPEEFRSSVAAGSRVWVNFRNKKELGYVVGLSPVSSIKNIKPILGLVDKSVLLDEAMLSLTRQLSSYYCCSWGEAIETALPPSLRKGRAVQEQEHAAAVAVSEPGKPEVLYDDDGRSRWSYYLQAARSILAQDKSVLIIVPDKSALAKAEQLLQAEIEAPLRVLSRNQPGEAQQWMQVRACRRQIVLGTRSAVFAPLYDLGLLILDDESNASYKQDQVPHYHCREAALMRCRLQKAKLILGCLAPSLETVRFCSLESIEPLVLDRKSPFPQVNIVDMKNLPVLDRKSRMIISRYLQDAIVQVLAAKGTVLVMLNRKGFATAAVCSQCAAVLRCPRCNVNLVYHFHAQALRCHYCDFSMAVPKICPSCNAGYIKFSGAGAEKLESEVARIFPQARIRMFDEAKEPASPDADILISTQHIVGSARRKFSLVAVLSIDNFLHHADFRASEKTFSLLWDLALLSDEKMIVQTSLPEHYCFSALKQNRPQLFYREEMAIRKQLKFPPFRHFAAVRCRGRDEGHVRGCAEKLFGIFSGAAKKKVSVLSMIPGQPPKLRGKYHWIVLLSGQDPVKLSAFIRLHLSKFKQSGIIITVDVDPL